MGNKLDKTIKKALNAYNHNFINEIEFAEKVKIEVDASIQERLRARFFLGFLAGVGIILLLSQWIG